MIYYYGTTISPNKTETVEGFLICRNVPIARIGQQTYLAKELELDGDPMRPIDVSRYPEDVFEAATLASFEGKPVTDNHPPENVSPENFSAYVKGHVQNVRREGDFIVADLHINDANLISMIQNHTKVEVSCGYMCTYVKDGVGYKQTHIRGNHVAVVSRGRAGHDVAIHDAAEETAEKRSNPMSNMLREVLKAFGKAAKDAEPEQLDELVEVTADALGEDEAQEAEPAEAPEKEPEAQDAEPAEEAAEETADEAEPEAEAKDEAEEQPAEDAETTGLEAKMDKILDLLQALLTSKSTDAEPSEEPAEEPGEAPAEEQEKSVTIPADEVGDGCSKDSAEEFLEKMGPVLMCIKDPKERQKVSDAMTSALSSDNPMGDIMNAAKDSAQTAAKQSAMTKYDKICEAQQNAYAARNPHKMKEV